MIKVNDTIMLTIHGISYEGVVEEIDKKKGLFLVRNLDTGNRYWVEKKLLSK